MGRILESLIDRRDARASCLRSFALLVLAAFGVGLAGDAIGQSRFDARRHLYHHRSCLEKVAGMSHADTRVEVKLKLGMRVIGRELSAAGDTMRIRIESWAGELGEPVSYALADIESLSFERPRGLHFTSMLAGLGIGTGLGIAVALMAGYPHEGSGQEISGLGGALIALTGSAVGLVVGTLKPVVAPGEAHLECREPLRVHSKPKGDGGDPHESGGPRP